jgi:uncharacterized protein (TIGR02145 family)
MSLTDPPFGLAVTSAAPGDPILRIGVTSALAVAVRNNTGAPVALRSGSSAFSVYLPSPDLFTGDQLKAITVTAPGWTGTFDASGPAISVTCSQAGTWADGQTLAITLGNVTTSGPAGNGTVTVVPADLGDNAPLSVEAPLAVASPARAGNLQLPDVLQVTLDSQGSVLRSVSAADPLSNTLYLTLKNTGATALATGSRRAGNPQVHVTFVYGNTSGALAPDAFDPAKGPQLGSAWNITAGIASAQAPWAAANPRADSQDPHPQWTLAPSPVNMQLLGPAGSDQANVTFSFSDLVSITPAGHTQMLVLCSGFARDDQAAYDDHLFVLDIAKLDAPPTRGLISFFGPDPVIPIADPDAKVTIPLRWAMFDVASVQLLSSSPVVAPQRKAYPVPPKPLDYDATTVTLPAPGTSEAIFFTLQAFDAGGGYLNSQQFTAYAQVSYVRGKGGHVYPIALFGSTYWMLANYQYHAPDGSWDYGDNPANEAAFGRLYDARALAQGPDGWSVPTVADWNALFAVFGDAKQAYAALAAGGRSGFNARLGGRRAIQPNGSAAYEQAYVYGYYWAADGSACAQFSSASGQASAGTLVPEPRTGLSVRFIRHA